MDTPCSVKTYGRYQPPPVELRSLNIVESVKVTIHDNLPVTHNKNPLLDLLHGRGITNCATLLYRSYRQTIVRYRSLLGYLKFLRHIIPLSIDSCKFTRFPVTRHPGHSRFYFRLKYTNNTAQFPKF